MFLTFQMTQFREVDLAQQCVFSDKFLLLFTYKYIYAIKL